VEALPMKRLTVSLFLIILVFQLFLSDKIAIVSASPDSTWLYVDTYNLISEDWITVGSAPYLDTQDQPTNYGYTSGNLDVWEEFTFADLSGSTGINSVNISVYCDVTTETITVYIWDSGAVAWSLAGTLSGSGWAWRSLDISTILTTEVEINNAKIYFKAQKDGAKFDNPVSIDSARLGIGYTSAGGETYNQYPQVQPKMNLAHEQFWTATRLFQVNPFFNLGFQRTWTANRAESITIKFILFSLISQTVIHEIFNSLIVKFALDKERILTWNRGFIETLKFTLDSFTNHLQLFSISPQLTLRISLVHERGWILTRNFVQQITYALSSFTKQFTLHNLFGDLTVKFTVDAERVATWFKNPSQILQFIISSIITHLETFNIYPVATIKINLQYERAFIATRNVFQTVQFALSSFIEQLVLKEVFSSVTVKVSLSSDRIVSWIRKTSQTVSFNLAYETASIWTRQFSQEVVFNLDSFVKHIEVGIYNIFNGISLKFTFNHQRIISWTRTFSEALQLSLGTLIKYTEYEPPPPPDETFNIFKTIKVRFDLTTITTQIYAVLSQLTLYFNLASSVRGPLIFNLTPGIRLRLYLDTNLPDPIEIIQDVNPLVYAALGFAIIAIALAITKD